MKTEQQLKIEHERIQSQLNRIDANRRTKENQQWVGKYFKYRNTCGGDCPGWWLYIKITKGGYCLKGFQFQLTSTGRFEASVKSSIFGGMERHEEISKAEYNRAWKSFCLKLKRAKETK
jgi:hypothetical protein